MSNVHLWGCIVGTEFRHISQLMNDMIRNLVEHTE